MRKITLIALAIGTALFSLVGCGDSQEASHRLSKAEKARLDSIDKASFKVGVMPTLDCLPLYVAQEENLFDTLGVTVHLKSYMAQMDCDTALQRGRVEGSVTDLIRAERLVKKGVKLTYPIATNAYWQLITNRKARVSELKQLSDKMIAITRFSATDYLADVAIDSAKPKFDVYRVQINDVRVRLKMLLNNEMDAVLLTEPQATKARLEKNPMLMDSREKNVNLGAFAFREKALEKPERRKQMQLFLKAYNMAVDSINKNGVAHYASLVKKYCDADEATVKALPKLRFKHATSPSQRDMTIAKKRL